MKQKKELPVVHLVEDRRTILSPYGRGNTKLGASIYTYSKLPGWQNSCPGSSEECEAICYAKRLVQNEAVWKLLTNNSGRGDIVPELPADAKIVRFHVSGDFGTEGYIRYWIGAVQSRPDVVFYGYTRSWRCSHLLPSLEELRRQPNVTLWASMDSTIAELPPNGWRRAWIAGDSRLTPITKNRFQTFDGRQAIVCLEENGLLPSCEACGFCWKDGSTDLVFLKH